ncbi:LamG-like jellyroll fold domain-containing protein [Sorangium sp. So ce136]|uniref:LamG domain-containing protein n=1 Tax=Sorangium sp. So ce136 TaxID=3133284 RepID=UPI003EFFBEA1
MALVLLSSSGCVLERGGTGEPRRTEQQQPDLQEERPQEERPGDELPEEERPGDGLPEEERPGDELPEEERPGDGRPEGELPEEERPVALCEAADASLIACFAFEGDPGDGSQHHFRPDRERDLSYAPGKDGQALRMTRGSRLRFGHDAAWIAPAMTIDVWINPASIPLRERYTIIDSGGKPSLFLMPGGLVRCTMGVEQNVLYPVLPGKWTHIACLSDGQTQSLYVNGVEVDRSASGPVLAQGDQPIHIGSDEPSDQDEFDGLIDSLRVFGRTLAPQEICKAAGREGC